jgi:hypothetical protein
LVYDPCERIWLSIADSDSDKLQVDVTMAVKVTMAVTMIVIVVVTVEVIVVVIGQGKESRLYPPFSWCRRTQRVGASFKLELENHRVVVSF